MLSILWGQNWRWCFFKRKKCWLSVLETKNCRVYNGVLHMLSVILSCSHSPIYLSGTYPSHTEYREPRITQLMGNLMNKSCLFVCLSCLFCWLVDLLVGFVCEPGSHTAQIGLKMWYSSKDDLEFLIPPPLSPGWWGCRHLPPYLALCHVGDCIQDFFHAGKDSKNWDTFPVHKLKDPRNILITLGRKRWHKGIMSLRDI